MAQTQQLPDINEALSEFYRLRSKYQENYADKYVNPIVNSDKSTQEKRQEFVRQPKPECINCKRNVGTIFTIQYDAEQLVRHFAVRCGDTQAPCPLNIQFDYAERQTYAKNIAEYSAKLSATKRAIIQEKNNAIFTRISPNIVHEQFQKYSEELLHINELLGYIIEKNLLVNHNPDRAQNLRTLGDDLQGIFIPNFQQLVRNEQYYDAAQLYINEIQPKLKEIMNLKYEINYVEYDPQEHVYHLEQRANSLQNLEMFIPELDKVVAFVKGAALTGRKPRQKTKATAAASKTQKVPRTATKPTKTTTTRKIPAKIIVEEEDVAEEEKEEGAEEKKR